MCAVVNTDEPPQKHKCKTKQCMINEMLYNHQDQVRVNESDGDKACSATNCQINLGRMQLSSGYVVKNVTDRTTCCVLILKVNLRSI